MRPVSADSTQDARHQRAQSGDPECRRRGYVRGYVLAYKRPDGQYASSRRPGACAAKRPTTG
jgi:hypothetical protein